MPPLAAPTLQQEPRTDGLYDRDFHSWALGQAEALQRRDLSAIDWDNLIEEIEGLALSQRNEWITFGARTIQHLMKIQYWDRSTKGDLQYWAAEVMDFRQAMALLIAGNPGMKGRYAEMFAYAWKLGRSMAVKSFQKYDRQHRGGTERTFRNWDRILPEECPYRLEHAAAFDPKTDPDPREDIWPPAIAGILNDRLGTDYPLLSDAEPRRSHGNGRRR